MKATNVIFNTYASCQECLDIDIVHSIHESFNCQRIKGVDSLVLSVLLLSSLKKSTAQSQLVERTSTKLKNK